MTTIATALKTGHVGLNVTDLDRSVVYYTEALGLEVQGRSDAEGRRFAFLGLGGDLILTLWEQAEGQFDPARPGLHHLSFQLPDGEALRETEGRVRALGAHVHHGGVVAHGEGSASGALFFDDPDGTRLEIYAPAAPGEFAPVHADGPSCGFF